MNGVLVLDVARPWYSDLCRDAMRHGAHDVAIVDATQSQYRVQITGERDVLETLREKLGLVRGGPLQYFLAR